MAIGSGSSPSRAEATSSPRSPWTAVPSGCTSTPWTPTWRAKAGPASPASCRRGPTSWARRPTRRIGCSSCSPTARRTTRSPTSSGQRSRSRRRVSGSSWWRKAAPLPRAFRSATRPARWSSTSATTTGRSSRPSGATTCSARSWMQPRARSSPATAQDQAGAVRDLVAAMKRSPSSATRTADLVPRGWIPGLVAALLLLAYTIARPGPALIGLAGLVLLVRPLDAQRPTAGGRALAAGDPSRAAAEFLKEAGAGRAKDTAFYNAGTAALQAGRLEVARGALAEAAKSLDPDLRYRALYNLGLVGLLAARADTARARRAARRCRRPPPAGAAAPAVVRAGQVEPGARRATAPATTAAERGRRHAAAHRRALRRRSPSRSQPETEGSVARARPSRSSTPWSGGSA